MLRRGVNFTARAEVYRYVSAVACGAVDSSSSVAFSTAAEADSRGFTSQVGRLKITQSQFQRIISRENHGALHALYGCSALYSPTEVPGGRSSANRFYDCLFLLQVESRVHNLTGKIYIKLLIRFMIPPSGDVVV